MAVYLGNRVFRSQDKAATHFKSIMARYNPGDRVKGSDDQIDLVNLLGRHPHYEQKVGSGIKGFSVENAALGSKCFHVHRTDGTSTDFSYRKCIAGRPKSPVRRFYEACRSAVQFDLLRARAARFRSQSDDAGRIQCEVTADRIGLKDCHVDHMKPFTFSAIVTAFQIGNGLKDDELGNLVVDSGDNMMLTRFKDEKFEAKFKRFHHDLCNKVGNLRLISAKVNTRLATEAIIRPAKKPVLIEVAYENRNRQPRTDAVDVL